MRIRPGNAAHGAKLCSTHCTALIQNPAILRDFFPDDPELATQAMRWERDLRAILDEIADAQ